jgi:hypothetical protein
MARTRTLSIPHSWTIEGWPADIYPNSASRARYIVRTHKPSLIAEGALARVGRDLVFFGANYHRWLERKRADVPGYEIAANRVTPGAGGGQRE